MERLILSWKEPFEVGKIFCSWKDHLQLERYRFGWGDIDVVGKIRLGVELGLSRRISSTKGLTLILP